MKNLYQRLYENGKSDIYPYHMPGHKRKALTETLVRVHDIDITEIDGFDNLHHAEDILRKAQDYAAQVYGSEQCFYLVNGSTSGILSAISATVARGKTILIGRNCHKSVYHGAYLNKINLEYVYPKLLSEYGFLGEITSEQIEEAILLNQNVAAVLIVSPTYEGVISDIKAIAEVVHKYNIPLIVDEAHGAHLGFHARWSDSACRLGADIVIQSLHKTLPSMTQTALLHVNGSLIQRSILQRYLSIYQTSSPSYVFMAGMEEAIRYMEDQGKEKMISFAQKWDWMLQELQNCKVLKVCVNGHNHDIGKLVISVANSNITGQELYDILLKEYHLQMEMAGGNYVLAMFTLADEEDAYQRLIQALVEIDKGLQCTKENIQVYCLGDNVKQYELWQAWDMPTEKVEINSCKERIAGEFINLYPPGAPIVVPGEVLTEEILGIIEEYIRQELPVHGVEKKDGKTWIKVVL